MNLKTWLLGSKPLTQEENFWKWFEKNQHHFLTSEFVPKELKTEKLFNQLAAQLADVNGDLSFELGPRGDKREFVISASGIKSSFPSVISLTKAAPKFTHWTITAFRPRRFPLNSIEIGEKCVSPEQVSFTLLDDGKIAGIKLFLPHFNKNDTTIKQIGYLMLDEALGEFDVETRLGLIEILPVDTPNDGNHYPLSELPRLFDLLVDRLEGRTGIPS